MYEKLTGYYEAIIVEDCHIQDETFKITIPSLFGTREKKDEGEEEILLTRPNELLNLKKKDRKDIEIKGTTIFTALNHTDYHFQLKGDVFVMDGSKGHLLKTLIIDKGGTPLMPGPITPHFHEWRDPHEMYNFIFENLNNVKLPKGTKCYGFFINGDNNINNFAVTRIEGAVPLSKGKAPKYVK